MPNRIIRKGLIDSRRIDKLGAEAERFYVRLLLCVDDFGRYRADPIFLRSKLFPLRDDIRSADMSRCLAVCEKARVVRCYEVAGERFLLVGKFRQRSRAEVSEFPPPPDDWPTDDGHASDISQTEDSPPRTDFGLRSSETEAVSADPQPPKAAERPIEERIYEAYPRKVGRQDAIKAIRKCCMAASGDAILESTIAYARAVSQWPPGEEQFVPHPSTWFNRGSFTDDPQTWNRQQRGDNGHRPERIADADEAIRRHQQEMME